MGRQEPTHLLMGAIDTGTQWIHIHGVGGVGKSTLLHAVARQLRTMDRGVGLWNAFFLGASPRALSQALFSEEQDVYMVDTFERAQVLELWLAEEVLGQRPLHGPLVTAGRLPLSPRLIKDGAATDAIRQFELGNLSPAAVADYLTSVGLPRDRFDELWRFSKGHPLALKVAASLLLADDTATVDIGSHPSALRFLMSNLLDHTPTTTHRRALEVLAVNRTTTEATLRTQLGAEDSTEVFEWLCERPITTLTPRGLAPHDLAREVLFAELNWRDPARCAELTRRAHIDAVERAALAPPEQLKDAVGDAVFSGGLRWRGAIELEEVPQCYPDRIRPDDDDAIRAIVERHQGQAAAELAGYWLDRARDRFLIGRGAGGDVLAFMLVLGREGIRPEDIARDPAIAEFDKLLRRRAAHDAYCSLARFYLMHDAPFSTENPGYHFLAEQLLIHLVFAKEPVIGASVETKYIVDNFAEAQVHQQAAEFRIGDTTFCLTFEDYRENPAMDLIRMHNAPGNPTPPVRPSQEIDHGFDVAVRDALKSFTNAGALRQNPLLDSCLVRAEDSGLTDPVGALRTLLEGACRDLSSAGGDDARHRRILEATYFDGSRPKQRQVASDLGTGYSTYRRHLQNATKHLVRRLWEGEWALRMKQREATATPASSRARWGIVGKAD